MATKRLIFLGGTVGNNTWRTSFTEQLLALGVAKEEIFNPVVSVWNEEARQKEEIAKQDASHLVFYIADTKLENSPLSTYSLVEATMALYDKHAQTVFIVNPENITGHALKALNQITKVLQKRFPLAKIFTDIQEALHHLAHNITR